MKKIISFTVTYIMLFPFTFVGFLAGIVYGSFMVGFNQAKTLF